MMSERTSNPGHRCGSCELSVVIATCPGRENKLRTLLSGIASTAEEYFGRIEIILMVDDLSEQSLVASSVLPKGLSFRGFQQASQGPACARNAAVEHARGKWLLFFDDDARVNSDTIPGHLERILADRDQPVAYLGRTCWAPELIVSPWRVLLDQTPMLFFWDRIRADRTYGFRYFWTNNLSVRTDLFRAVGGFNESFPYPLHEDIELGWRLDKEFGLHVQPALEITSWHDHALTPRDYFYREYRSGQAAAVARDANPGFHDAVWPWLGDARTTTEVLDGLFAQNTRPLRSLLEAWSVPSKDRPSPELLQAVYFAHLPMKRLAFCAGYTGRPFTWFWNDQDETTLPTACMGSVGVA